MAWKQLNQGSKVNENMSDGRNSPLNPGSGSANGHTPPGTRSA
jgi:hypothetical protein